MTNTQCMLTTTDNPWDPFTDFEAWFAYDSQKGYGTCSYLARIANSSQELSDEDNDFEMQDAIDQIVQMDLIALVTNNEVHYKKLYENESLNKNKE